MTILGKREFVTRVARRVGVTKRDTSAVFEAIIKEMEQIVKDGDTLKFKRFGMLSSVDLPDRNGYSVKEKKVIWLTGGRRVNFKLAENIRFPGMLRGKHLEHGESEDDDVFDEDEPLTE